MNLTGNLPGDDSMKTISLKLSDALDKRLERAAKRRKQTKASIVRAALEQFLNGAAGETPVRAGSVLDLAGDLVGCVEGPGDLSTNPKYMRGYGE